MNFIKILASALLGAGAIVAFNEIARSDDEFTEQIKSLSDNFENSLKEFSENVDQVLQSDLPSASETPESEVIDVESKPEEIKKIVAVTDKDANIPQFTVIKEEK